MPETANLAIANLSFAVLAGAILTDADLRGTGLAFANLAGANLEGANLSDAALRGADLRGAKLTNANGLTQYQINQAGAGDSKTELPKGLDRPKWWTNNSGAIVREPMTAPILPDSMLEDSRFGASLVALKSLSSELRDEIRIPKKVGNMNGTATGALVYDVRPGSPADSAGFRAGDVIVTVGENQVQDLEDLKRTLEQDHAGTQVKFGTWRYYFPQGWRKGELYPKLGD